MGAHVLIIADGRSPTALGWIANIRALGYRVSLVSTFPCPPPEGMVHFSVLPVALSRLSSSMPGSPKITSGTAPRSPGRSLLRRFAPLFQTLRYSLGPLTLLRFANAYAKLLSELKPDLVHALRIPFEGMLGSYTPEEIPFVAATWGNDLTLHASGSVLMRTFTKRCLARANGFCADTHRDVRLAHVWGLPDHTPTLVVPGSGGLDLEEISSAPAFQPAEFAIPTTGDWVVNPRGLRPGSLHQDVFFAAIPKILAQYPQTRFICPGLANVDQAATWIKKHGIEKNTHLLPKLPQSQLWSLLKFAQLYVSPSSHDGTPNSLLEAMACGCFPVVGNIESLREWVKDGVNGLLVDPTSPQDLAGGICRALEEKNLRQRAAEDNLAQVTNRAAQEVTRPLIDAFYQRFFK